MSAAADGYEPFKPHPWGSSRQLVRHSMLWRFAFDDERRAVEQTMELIGSYLDNTFQFGGLEERDEKTELVLWLEAAVGDLRDSARDLESIRRAQWKAQSQEERTWQAMCGEWAERAGSLSNWIEQALRGDARFIRPFP